MGISVGIDLGTTFCAVAIINKEGLPQVIENSRGERVTPSVIKITDNGFIFGAEAKDAFDSGDTNCVVLFKRNMGN